MSPPTAAVGSTPLSPSFSLTDDDDELAMDDPSPSPSAPMHAHAHAHAPYHDPSPDPMTHRFADDDDDDDVDGNKDDDDNDPTMPMPWHERLWHAMFSDGVKPWHVNAVLVFAILSVSSAGAVMKAMDHAAPLSRASWRLQVTSMILLPGFLWQWRRAEKDVREDFLESRTVVLLLTSGVALAFHFGLWVYSLDLTSLPHSLLFVCTPPLILTVAALLRGDSLSPGEIGGLGVGALGALAMAGGSAMGGGKVEHDASIVGDLSAFLAAGAFAAYISIGAHLREWMPLFLYVLPVTASAASLLLLAALLAEGWQTAPEGRISGPFGWMGGEFFLPTLYLALFSGVGGHAGLAFAARYTSPLALVMALTVEPLLGSLLGRALGVSGAPGFWTYVGGILLMLATIVVNYAGELKKSQAADLSEEGGGVRMSLFTLDDDDDWDASSAVDVEGLTGTPKKGKKKTENSTGTERSRLLH